jgi:ankyrin repeat protein
LIVQAGANAHCMDEQLRTPMLEASAAGHLKVVNLLNKSGAVADFKVCTLWCQAERVLIVVNNSSVNTMYLAFGVLVMRYTSLIESMLL